MHQLARGCIGCHGDHRKGHAIHRIAHIAGQVGHRDRRRVVAIIQCVCSHRPESRCIRIGLKHRATQVHRHVGVGFRVAFQRGRSVVGDVVGLRHARVIVQVVHQSTGRSGRGNCIDGDAVAFRLGRIASGIRCRKYGRIGAVGQTVCCDRPEAVLICLHRIQHGAAYIHRDPGKWIGRAFKRGRCIVGNTVGSVQAGVIGFVVNDIAADVGRSLGINSDGAA